MRTDFRNSDFDLRETSPQLAEPSLWHTSLSLAGDWLVVAGSIGLHLYQPNIVTFLVAQLLIASRQHALFVMMHEGAHAFFHRNRRVNDWISNGLAAWPIFISTERFRARHWVHHRFTGSDQDPDWQRKLHLADWQFPRSQASFWKIFGGYLWGRGVIEMALAFYYLGVGKDEIKRAAPYYVVAAAALTVTVSWQGFVLYWLLPYFTILPVLHRFRMIAEHYAVPNQHVLNNTRNVISNPFATYFLGPHATNLHLTHHLCPYIPWFNVPKARRLLLENQSYRQFAHENEAYVWSATNSTYGDLTSTNQIQPASADQKSA